MTLSYIYNTVKEKLDEKMSVSEVYIISRIPKQELLPKSDLIILTNGEKVLWVEWYEPKVNRKFNVDNGTVSMKVIEKIKRNPKLIHLHKSESTNINFQTINYGDLETTTRNLLKDDLFECEQKLKTKVYNRQQEFCKKNWSVFLNIQTDIFKHWLDSNGYNEICPESFKKAYDESEQRKDFHLRKRAIVEKALKLKGDLNVKN